MATAWDVVTIYNVYASIWPLFMTWSVFLNLSSQFCYTLPLYANSVLEPGDCVRSGHCLQFILENLITIWGLATVYNFHIIICLLFETSSLFSISVLVSGRYLRPGRYFQFHWE
jgi:hypothetical protein